MFRILQTVSNVPGPQEPVAFAKKQLKRVHMVFNNAMPQVTNSTSQR